VADDEVQKLAGNLSDLNKITLQSGIEFQGFAKRLIKMSDATSKAGKKWTIFGRLVSGSPLWRLQNKVRAFVDILAQVEESSRANAEAAKEQNQRVIDSVQSYESLQKPLASAILLQKSLSSGTMLHNALRRKGNKELKEAIKGSFAYNLAIMQGEKKNVAYAKGLDEIIKKGKQQQEQFMVARKQAIFEKNMKTEKGRAKILKDIRKQQEEIALARPKLPTRQAIGDKAIDLVAASFDGLLKAQETTEKVMETIKKEGLIKSANIVFDKWQVGLKKAKHYKN